MNKDDLINKFNIIIKNMVDHIDTYYGDTLTNKIKYIIHNTILLKPNEPISFFILYIYKNDEYRRNILNYNDKFFIESRMDDITNGDNDKICKLFEFKQLWTICDDNTKNFIKKTMIVLITICTNYIHIL